MGISVVQRLITRVNLLSILRKDHVALAHVQESSIYILVLIPGENGSVPSSIIVSWSIRKDLS